MAYNAADLFIEALVNEGIEIIYGVPGEENLDLLDAIRKSSINLVLTRHEQAGAFMAATYGRLTGKVGAVVSTLGPGATNFTTAAAYAQLGGFPLLMITGQKPIKASKQGRFQIIDVVSMMTPITKYSRQIVDVNMVCSTVRDACRIAQEEKPGAVHIEFPEDVSAELVTSNTKKVFPVSFVSNFGVDDAMVSKVADIITSSKLPLVLIGAACNRHNISSHIRSFINDTGLPVFSTQMGKGVIPENHLSFIGTAALSAGDCVHDLVAKSDLIIHLGTDVVEKPAYFPSTEGAKVIHINYYSATVDNIYQPHYELIGDIPSIVQSLAKYIGKATQDFSYAARVRKAYLQSISSSSDSFPVRPSYLVAEIQSLLADEGILSLDNGMYKLWFARNYAALHPNSLLLDNALATMGAGLPAAMEASRLYPKKHVLAVIGDGGFMMNSQELETAMRLELNFVVLILNDNAYGMIRWKQDGMGFGDYGLQFKNPDFVAYAQSYGAFGHKISSSTQLIPLLRDCFSKGGIHVIDLPVDYSENKEFFTNWIKHRKSVE